MRQTIANFKPMASAIDTIYLVEASPILREAQRRLLCDDSPVQEHPMGQQSTCKRIPNAKVIWVEDIKFIPRGLHFCPSLCKDILISNFRGNQHSIHNRPRILRRTSNPRLSVRLRLRPTPPNTDTFNQSLRQYPSTIHHTQ